MPIITSYILTNDSVRQHSYASGVAAALDSGVAVVIVEAAVEGEARCEHVVLQEGALVDGRRRASDGETNSKELHLQTYVQWVGTVEGWARGVNLNIEV